MKSGQHKLTAAVRNCLAQNLRRGEGVTVALSGGMDSASLLDCALQHAATWPVSACHINHGISSRAAAWEDFCRQLCEQRGIVCHIRRASPPKNASEQWAREVRMGFFADLPMRAIMAAHHQEDQAETVLFRVLRGTNAHGMGAMRPCAPLPGAPHNLILRPWLAIPKEDIQQYAKARRLHWVEDEDNRNTARRRNFLRYRVMPVLRECFPNGSQTLAAAADRFSTAATLLAQLADEDGNNASPSGHAEWDLAYFRRIGEERLQNFLHVQLSRAGMPFTEKGLVEITKQLLNGHANITIPLGRAEIVVRQGKMQIYPPKTASKTPAHIPKSHATPPRPKTRTHAKTAKVTVEAPS